MAGRDYRGQVSSAAAFCSAFRVIGLRPARPYSGLRDHVDWNIQNFVFEESSECLFYVDLKPATFVGSEGK
jgi:hypothetical protein